MNARLAVILATLAYVGPCSLPALASSLPRVDFGERPLIGVGIGSNQSLQAGGSLSIDAPINDAFMVGGAAASTIGGGVNYDVRGVYRFIVGSRGTGPSIAAIVGLWGQPGRASFATTFGAAPFVGFGMAYAITERITARLDLAYAPFFNYATANETFVFLGGPPTSGAEVGYRLTPNLEATLGINGRGDFLGASYSF